MNWQYTNIKMSIPKGFKIYKRDLKLTGISEYMNNFIFFLEEGNGELNLYKEEDNIYDKNAMYLSFNNRKLGYIPKAIAKQLKKIDKELGIRIFKIGISEDQSAGFMSFDLLIEK